MTHPGDSDRRDDEPGRDSAADLTGWTDTDSRPRKGPTEAPPDASTFGVKVFLASLTMLFGGTLIGYVVFRDVPDAATLMGAGLIITGGLVLVERSSKLPQTASTP